MPIAHFKVTPEGRKVEGDYAVYLDRVLFRAGDYPEHAFCLSEAEMRASAERFVGPAAGNIEHTAFLAGKAVFVDALRVDAADAGLLRGDVRIPLALDECLGDAERKVSAEWDTATKDFLRLALTTSPAIREADLMATFAAKAKAGTPHGRQKMQTIHDHAAQSGAYCADATDSAPARFVSRAERGGLQKIHDLAVEHGASCPGSPAYYSSPAPKGTNMGLFSRLAKALGHAPEADQLTDAEELAVFAKLAPEEKVAEKVAEPKVEPPATADFSQNAEFVALKASAAATAAQNATFKARLLEGDAKAWVATLAGKTLPAEHAAMVAAFAQATLDDEAPDGVARFSAGAKAVAPSRLDLLKAMFAARPDHKLYGEVLAQDLPAGSVLLPPVASFSDKDKPDPKELDTLRGYSHLLRDAKVAKSA